jgi:precorrin-2/cobalt-factor-2 C20-methyltransferase
MVLTYVMWIYSKTSLGLLASSPHHKCKEEKLTSPKLTAVGLGPGDPELITLKGLRAIEAADLIFVPRSQNGEKSLALRIAQPWLCSERQQVVELPLPMTRNAEALVPAWQSAADQIARNLGQLDKEEARGAYLLLGDPLLYGTFTYIWGELAARHPNIVIEILPGVTSFAAAAARAQFPLSATSDRVAVLPASYETDAGQLSRLLADYETVILLKVGPVLPQILAALDEMDLLDSSLYAERVGMPEEHIAIGPEIRTLHNQRRPYLSLLIVRQRSKDR